MYPPKYIGVETRDTAPALLGGFGRDEEKTKERMKMVQCFKIKEGTKYSEAVKKHDELYPKWKGIFKQVSEKLGEEIKVMYLNTDWLRVSPEQLTKDENKRLFTQDGRLKKNSKEAKAINEWYLSILKEAGLSEFQNRSYLNFAYGVYRLQGDHLESWNNDQGVIYFKASFDLEKRSNGAVDPITEIEYEEQYLKQLKRVMATA